MNYLEQTNDIKVKVFDRILKHLLYDACKDERHREQLRVKIALKKIKGWILEAGGK